MKHLFIAAIAIIALASCGGGKTNAGNGVDSTATDSIAADSIALKTKEPMTLTTNTFKYSKKDKTAEVKVEIEYPTSGDPTLCEAIRQTVLSLAEHNFPGDKTNGKAVANYLGKSAYDNAHAMWTEVDKENKESAVEGSDFEYTPQPPYAVEMTVKKVAETTKYITISITTYEYLGGAHGSTAMQGITFSKLDGKKINDRVLKNSRPKGLNNIIKNGLKKYFAECGETIKSDADLADQLLLEEGKSVNDLPLPAEGLYISAQGIVFCYGQYEIAPYAAGIPTFTVPFEQLKPYMTYAAIDLF